MNFDMIMEAQELVAIASVVAEEDFTIAQEYLDRYQNELRSIDYNHDVVEYVEKDMI